MSVKSIIITIAIVFIITALSSAGYFITANQKEKDFNVGLNAAKTNYDSGDKAKCVEQLDTLMKNFPRSKSVQVARYFYAMTNFEMKNYEASKKAFEDYLNAKPEANLIDDCNYYIAQITFINERDNKKALSLYEQIIKDYPESDKAKWAQTGLAEIAFARGDFKKAKSILAPIYEQTGDDLKLKDRVEELIGKVNLAIVFSRDREEQDIIYTVQRGDLLTNIARDHHVSPELLIRCNGLIDARKLVVNKRIKIPNLEFSIVVDKWTNELYLYNKGKFFKKYKVRTGVYNDQTPVGEYKILSKNASPVWNNPKDGKRYEANDPTNELGTRWMSFLGASLGIHGTIHPETLGKYSSNGCVGMLMPDVEELYNLVSVGTPLKIIGEQNPAILEKNVVN